MLSERSQTQKVTLYDSIHMSYPKQTNLWKQISSFQSLGGEEEIWLLLGIGFSFGVKKMFGIKIVVMVAQSSEYIKNHWVVYSKGVNFMFMNYISILKVITKK